MKSLKNIKRVVVGKKPEENKEFKKYSKLYESVSYLYEIEQVIYQYLYSLHINKKWIKNALEEMNKDIKYEDIRENIKKLEYDYLYDLQMTETEYTSQLLNILEENKEYIIKIYPEIDLKAKLDKLGTNLDDKLRKEILENYVKTLMDRSDNELVDKDNKVEEMQEIFPELESYIKQYRASYRIEEDLVSFFSKQIYQGTGYLSTKHEMIILKNKEIIIDEILKDKELFRSIITIIGNYSRNSNIEYLKEIVNEIENKDERYKNKIQKIKDSLPEFGGQMNNEVS